MTSRLFVLLLAALTLNTQSYSQCPGSLDCEGAEVLCSVEILHELECSTPMNPNTTFPNNSLCFGVGTPHNLTWWSFIGAGGALNLTFQLDMNSCVFPFGIQAGVFEGSCDGSVVWDCNASCNTSTFTLSGATTRGRNYFIWVDGCNGDVCDFNISVNGNSGSVTLPDNIPDFTVNGQLSTCGEIEVCMPDLGSTYPTVQWFIADSLISKDTCTIIEINNVAGNRDSMDICMVLTLGNPDNPGAICDQDTVCKSYPLLDSVRTEQGSCAVVCPDDQPYIWGGQIIRSSCINPPCTARFGLDNGICIDSVKPIILLAPLDTGRKDTFICDYGVPYVDENDIVYTGEICEEIVTFRKIRSHPECPGRTVRCDTSYLLSIGRFDHSSNWEVICAPCGGKFILCPNIELATSCPVFNDQVSITLEWYNESGDFLGETAGSDCLQVDDPGVYCVNIQGSYRDQDCIVTLPECYNIPETLLPEKPAIHGEAYVCDAGFGVYEVDSSVRICEYSWSIPDGQGEILTANSRDSNRIRVDWSGKSGDESLVCLEIKGDCGTADSCFTVFFDSVETLPAERITRCSGDTIILEEPVSTISREWSTGDTSASIAVRRAGTYCISGQPIDSSCVIEKCFEVVNSQVTISDTIIQGDSGNGDGSITVMINSNETISVIAWSNGETKLSISDLEAGTYDLLILTRSGCIYAFRFVVPLETSTSSEKEPNKLEIFPNPGSSFTIHPLGSELIERVAIFSVDGKPVISERPPRTDYDLSAEPDGLYLIKIKLRDGRTRILKWTKFD
ncbi:MAG: T9SS type A sorting domain-containing protein [Saprospiraceae bacterium]|nr:T9SS type A sorting domain-containing protein [Saprospiraceae bacterium]